MEWMEESNKHLIKGVVNHSLRLWSSLTLLTFVPRAAFTVSILVALVPSVMNSSTGRFPKSNYGPLKTLKVAFARRPWGLMYPTFLLLIVFLLICDSRALSIPG